MKKRCFLSNLAHCPVSIPYGNIFRGYKNWILGWNGSNFSETFLEKNCILSFRKISEERQCFYQIHINMNAYNLKLYWKINSIIELKTNSIAHWDYNEHSTIKPNWPVWLTGLVLVYKISDSGFESRRSHLNFKCRACFEKGVLIFMQLQILDSF